MTSCIVYARYSSDMSRDASIEDQVRLCNQYIVDQKWTIAGTFEDRAISGASVLRPGYQSLLALVRQGSINVVLAEALDRLSRDQEDIAALFKIVRFAGAKLVTLAEGEVSELHIGLKGTMNALFLKDLALKTKRGLEGRIGKGRSAGGNAYGYDVVREYGPDGPIDRGRRTINTDMARVIVEIFTRYLNGESPRAIAYYLNAQKTCGPRGRDWTASTLIGNRTRGTGILNNELYIGKLVWNRQTFMKDPVSGKRQARMNPQTSWITEDVPNLRIIDDATWDDVQRAQKQRSRPTRPDKKSVDGGLRRPKHLFSGLLKCGACGASFTLVSGTYYGCAARKNKGTCSNSERITIDRLENAVLGAVQSQMMTPELTKVFIAEYSSALSGLRKEAVSSKTEQLQKKEKLKVAINNIVDVVASGHASAALLTKLTAFEEDLEVLEKALQPQESAPLYFHPNLAQHYERLVYDLRALLNKPDCKQEAVTALRKLIDRIDLVPSEGGLSIDIVGNLAAMLQLTMPNMQKAASKETAFAISLVAGAGLNFGRTRY